jgi:hypothetical protein
LRERSRSCADLLRRGLESGLAVRVLVLLEIAVVAGFVREAASRGFAT